MWYGVCVDLLLFRQFYMEIPWIFEMTNASQVYIVTRTHTHKESKLKKKIIMEI